MSIPQNAQSAMDELYNVSALLSLGRNAICEFPSSLRDVSMRDLTNVMNLCRVVEMVDQMVLDVLEYVDDIRDTLEERQK